jgi:hypothetical protein
MKVFISWSGRRSLAVAEALRDWLPTVINAVQPYVTSKDMDKGTVWTTEIMKNLSDAQLGIVCLTADNLNAPWVLFESGALAKAVTDRQRVCTYLLDLKPTDLAPPLSMFQATQANESDTRRMVETINAVLGPERLTAEILAKSFPRNWPALAEDLQGIPKTNTAQASRSDADKLDEILRTMRSLSQRLVQEPDPRIAERQYLIAGFENTPFSPGELAVLRMLFRLPKLITIEVLQRALEASGEKRFESTTFARLVSRGLVTAIGAGPEMSIVLTGKGRRVVDLLGDEVPPEPPEPAS